MIQTISFSSEGYDPFSFDTYERLQNRLQGYCEQYGLPHTKYTHQQLRETDFYAQNKSMLDEKRTAGYGCWKPYIILDAFNRLNWGDIVCYMDVSTRLGGDPTSIINTVKDFWVHDTIYPNREWCKRDAFVLMDCDTPLYYDAHQVWSGIVIARKTVTTIQLISDWMHFGCIRRIVSDDSSVLPNLPEFKDTRCDQTALTLLVLKYMHKHPGIEIKYQTDHTVFIDR